MRNAILSIRDRLDRVGVLLSGLCALHCLAGLMLVAGLGFGGEVLLAPAITASAWRWRSSSAPSPWSLALSATAIPARCNWAGPELH